MYHIVDQCPKQVWVACTKQVCDTKQGHHPREDYVEGYTAGYIAEALPEMEAVALRR